MFNDLLVLTSLTIGILSLCFTISQYLKLNKHKNKKENSLIPYINVHAEAASTKDRCI
jgi:hypothetical protein